jgi:hypothetical protein
MNYNVKTIAIFERQAKRLIKRYPSLRVELMELIQVLKKEPVQGESLGKNCYKVRLAISSNGKGKSGGVRIMTNLVVTDSIVFLLSIYDKSEKSSISDKELIALLKQISS